MIKRQDVMPINFLKKEAFTGSDTGMRYRMERLQEEETALLLVTAWPEPYCFDATEEKDKISARFSFDESGIEAGVEWLNGRHPDFRGGQEQ